MVNQNYTLLQLEEHNVSISLKRSLGNHPASSNSEDSQFSAPFVFTNKLLGKGSNSEVYLGYDSITLQKLAIKTINLKRLSANSKLKLQKEIEILQKLKSISTSDRFVKFHKATLKQDNNDIFYLAMDFIPGSDLYVLCSEYSLGIPETLTKQIFYNIILAVNELHSNQICHLDLKLENIMYNKDTNSVKLVDFGFSQFTTNNNAEDPNEQVLQTVFCGSIHYAAPELLSRVPFDGKKADVWSLGVVLFAMLSGQFPFDDYEGNAMKIFQRIRNDEVEYPMHFSNLQLSLLSMMLEKDPLKRCSIEDVLDHPYFASMRSVS